MLKGIQLTLMMGTGSASAVPKSVIDALISIQVTEGKDQSGFQLSFSIGKNSVIQQSLLPQGFFDPIKTRVIVAVTTNGSPNVLIDGLVTNHELSPSNEAGKSTLTITGQDLSVAMDLVQNIIPYPAMPDMAKVLLRLAPYAALGIIPMVIPPISTVIKSLTEGFDTQKTTDRVFIKNLAQKNGYVFYIQPGPAPGQSVAYFGPEVNISNPQSALSVNMDANTNVESMSFSMDGLAKKIRVYTILDPVTKKIPIPIPLPNISPFKPPMGQKISPPFKVEFFGGGAKKSLQEAAQDMIGFLLNESNAGVSGSGSLDVLRYGRILRSRMLVGVRGAGKTYDGHYYVDSVTHDLKPGSYKQSFNLSRDGLVSNVSNIAV